MRLLAATAAVAIGAPIGTALWVGHRTDELASHLGRAGGVPARIGKLDADLTGTLRLSDVSLGELSADNVELIPDEGGVRVITGRLHVRGGDGRIHGELELARSSAELALPHVRFGRVLAVAGTGTLAIGDRIVGLHAIAAGRLQPGG